MRVGKRKAWLEKQPEEIRLYVLGLLGDPAVTYEEASRRLEAKFGLKVPPSTLAYSRTLTVGQDEEDLQAAKKEAARYTEFIRQNPDVPEERLRKTWFYRQLASKEFRDGAVAPGKLVFLAQRERELELKERQIAAVEEQNKLKVQQVDLERRRVEVLERKIPKAKEELEGVIQDEKASPAEIRRRIREIFGVFDAAPAPERDPGPAVSGPVGA